jgi:hypothetical protein
MRKTFCLDFSRPKMHALLNEHVRSLMHLSPVSLRCGTAAGMELNRGRLAEQGMLHNVTVRRPKQQR